MASLAKLEEKYERALATARTVREKAKRPIEVALRSTVVSGGAFGIGYLKGRYGEPELLGMPADLIGSVAGHLGAFLIGSDSAAGNLLHGLSDAGLAGFTYQAGFGAGIEAAAEENEVDIGTIVNRRAEGKEDDGSDPEEE